MTIDLFSRLKGLWSDVDRLEPNRPDLRDQNYLNVLPPPIVGHASLSKTGLSFKTISRRFRLPPLPAALSYWSQTFWVAVPNFRPFHTRVGGPIGPEGDPVADSTSAPRELARPKLRKRFR